MIVLIPAYEPGARLAPLVRALHPCSEVSAIVVVDDGSGSAYDAVLCEAATAGAVVVRRNRPNRGKGYTLREGYRYIQAHYPNEVVVTADCDGQHLATDILRVGERAQAKASQPVIVLGGRRFTGDVPVRSRFGNAVSRQLFRLVSGSRVHDTQTGLRAASPLAINWLLTIGGDRFEYEFRALLEARQAGVELDEIAIETVYLNENESSHFRPLVDSARVYRLLLEFAGASLLGFTVDAAMLVGLAVFAPALPLWSTVVIARVVSMTVNFLANRFVFRSRKVHLKTSAARYIALATALLAVNYLILSTLVALGVNLVLAKFATEILVWLGSYSAQHRWVFRSHEQTAREQAKHSSGYSIPLLVDAAAKSESVHV